MSRKVKRRIDLTGNKYGLLTVIKDITDDGFERARWLCMCDCGNYHETYSQSLKCGTSLSCGCLTDKRRSEASTTHGMSNSPEYSTWQSMKGRCLNKNDDRYESYGGRGITICEEWLVFENFYRDMGKRPCKKSIDRINNNKGYSKDNCKWSTDKEQKQNMRSNHYLEYNGKKLSIAAWSEKLGIDHQMLSSRIARGWTVKDALESPKGNNSEAIITLNGETKHIGIFSKELGINRHALVSRIKRGWTYDRIKSTPLKEKQTEYSDLEYKGETKTLSEWCKELNLKRRIIWKRLKRGWSITDSFEVPELNNSLKLKNIRKKV